MVENRITTDNGASIVLYTTDDGNTQLEVKLEKETVWLNREQMAQLYGRDYKTIAKHINNALKEELAGESVVAKFAIPKKYGRKEGVVQMQSVEYYNLDMIISVGYRVKSKNGIAFRKWANHDKVSDGEYSGLFNVITDYVYALDTLDRYDFQSLQIDKTTSEEPFHATYENAMEAINALKVKFGGSQWFANEKDDSFKSSIGQIYQSFGGEDLYPSVEEKAAMLLYLVVKKLHAKMGDRLNIVSISVDKQRKDWERAMEDEKMPWQQALVPQTSMKALGDAYFVRYIPSLVVIDPDGNIQLYTNAPDEAHRYLEEKLN